MRDKGHVPTDSAVAGSVSNKADPMGYLFFTRARRGLRIHKASLHSSLARTSMSISSAASY